MARKLNIEETTTGFPPHEDAILKECMKQFRSALCLRWLEAKKEKEDSDNATVGLSFGFTINTAGKKPVVKGVMVVKRPSKREETQGVVEDPNQREMTTVVETAEAQS